MSVPRLPASRCNQVAALDLASTTGFAIGAFGERPRFGAVQMRGETTAQRMAALREFLEQQDGFLPISAIVLEAALIGEHSSTQAAEVLTSLQAMAELFAYDLEIPVVRVASSSARKLMLGTARFPRGEAKKHVAEWARSIGFETASHDAADALCVWKAVECATLGTQPPMPGRLMAGV